jgi:hypothetical protein
VIRDVRATLLIVLATCAAAAATAATAMGPAPAGLAVVTATARPAILITRGDVRVEARVRPDADNRVLTIAWSSDTGTAGQTVRPLDGDDGPVLHELLLPATPAANYLFVASVFDKDGHLRGRAEAKILAPDRDGEDR